ncbi:hypothetical protein AD951_04770 [Acetobacter malorum]|uniref:Uncharacterized protein n=1 Tax=Acetobacter malorum TaxID=178901 RepID=A0A149UPI6_9PROT|nr:hypothetical protein [Acetobacter malorum]KXV69857.1 hypothetical protein AD951_04770 [Acetobacter malorum]
MDMNPIDVFVNVARLFLPGVNLVFAIIGLFGLYAGYKALYDAYRTVRGDQAPGIMPKEAILPVLFLAGGAIVVPVVLWQGANTFVLGGTQTYNMFSYLQQTDTDSTCTNLSRALTQLCMFMGSLSVLRAAVLIYGRQTEPGRGLSYTAPLNYFVGGIFLFFINDLTWLISNTAGISLGMDSICTALSVSSG